MKAYKIFLLGLTLSAIAIWLAVWQFDDKFHLISCNVGQGDATLITYKSTQVLVDGGPNSKVIDCLSRHMPFWDRQLELVILTHPEIDHYGGLIEVFKHYKVTTFLRNSLPIISQDYQVLKELVGGGRVRELDPVPGMVIRVGLIHLDILINSENREGDTEENINQFSIISLVHFGNFQALLTGDYEFKENEKFLDSINSIIPQEGVEYIKIPHHGSKNGLTRGLLEITKPKLAVISVGKNQWGHPVPEILELLADFEVKTLRTDEKGDIEIISDGTSSWMTE